MDGLAIDAEWEGDPLETLQMLKSPWAPYDYVAAYYGLDLSDETLVRRLQAWSDQDEIDEVIRPDDETVHRVHMERFFAGQSRLPARFAAASLGMELESFRKVVDELSEKFLIDWQIRSGLAPKNELREFHKLFGELRLEVFRDINQKMRKLHAAIEEDLGIEVTALRCVTSEALGDEDPPAYAQSFDALVPRRATSTRYRKWLDTGKPLYLAPDACSTLTYAEYENDLESSLIAGEDSGIPEKLRQLTSGSVGGDRQTGHA